MTDLFWLVFAIVFFAYLNNISNSLHHIKCVIDPDDGRRSLKFLERERKLFKLKQEIGRLEGKAYKLEYLSRYFLLIKIMLLECEYDDRAVKLAKRLQEAEEKRRNF